MRLSPVVLFGLLSWATASIVGPTAAGAQSTEEVQRLFDEVVETVVQVRVFDRNRQLRSTGSGAVVSPEGLVATNYHVIKNGYFAEVVHRDGRSFQVLGVVAYSDDATRDFALLKIETSGAHLSAAELGNAEGVEKLDRLLAVGHPRGLPTTPATGEFQALLAFDRSWQPPKTCSIEAFDAGREYYDQDFECHRWLQNSVPISPGNSGGPLFSMSGEVVGLTTWTWFFGGDPRSQNLNFAVPVNAFKGFVGSPGTVRHTLTDLAERQKEEDQRALAAAIEYQYPVYTDRDSLFAIRYPREWKVKVGAGEDPDTHARLSAVMFHPEDCWKCELAGYLSEGIRVIVERAPVGKVWTLTDTEEYASRYVEDFLSGNPQFVQTEARKIDFKGQEAMVFSFVGQNANIPEPEKTTLVVFAEPGYRTTVELTSPTSKLRLYDRLYLLLTETLEITGPELVPGRQTSSSNVRVELRNLDGFVRTGDGDGARVFVTYHPVFWGPKGQDVCIWMRCPSCDAGGGFSSNRLDRDYSGEVLPQRFITGFLPRRRIVYRVPVTMEVYTAGYCPTASAATHEPLLVRDITVSRVCPETSKPRDCRR